MIVDAHVHIHPNPKGFGERYDASVYALVDRITESPIDKAVVLPIAPFVSDEFVYEACVRMPDKLIGFASWDPRSGEAGLRTLRVNIERYGLKGLKLHPRMQGFGMSDFELVKRTIREMAAIGAPVVIDSFPSGRGILQDRSLELAQAIAQDVPGAALILTHMGGIRAMEAYMLTKAYKNIYLDISFSLKYFEGSSLEMDMRFIIGKIGAERCIYGSDHPQMDIVGYYEEALEFIDGAGVGQEGRAAIMGENILRLLPS